MLQLWRSSRCQGWLGCAPRAPPPLDLACSRGCPFTNCRNLPTRDLRIVEDGITHIKRDGRRCLLRLYVPHHPHCSLQRISPFGPHLEPRPCPRLGGTAHSLPSIKLLRQGVREAPLARSSTASGAHAKTLRYVPMHCFSPGAHPPPGRWQRAGLHQGGAGGLPAAAHRRPAPHCRGALSRDLFGCNQCTRRLGAVIRTYVLRGSRVLNPVRRLHRQAHPHTT
jgi:hypothetical protein